MRATPERKTVSLAKRRPGERGHGHPHACEGWCTFDNPKTQACRQPRLACQKSAVHDTSATWQPARQPRNRLRAAACAHLQVEGQPGLEPVQEGGAHQLRAVDCRAHTAQGLRHASHARLRHSQVLHPRRLEALAQLHSSQAPRRGPPPLQPGRLPSARRTALACPAGCSRAASRGLDVCHAWRGGPGSPAATACVGLS